MSLEFGDARWLWLLLILPIVWVLIREPARMLSSDRVGLWEAALRRVGRRKNRASLRRWLALLACLLLVLAAAQPRRPERAGFAKRVVVLDLSASMWAKDAHGMRRIEAARKSAHDAQVPAWVDTEVYALTQAGLRRLDALASLDELTVLRDAKPGAVDLDAAMKLASKVGDRVCVQLFSDGAAASPWPQDAPNNVRLYGFGQSDAPNAAIVSARIEDPWPGPALRVELALRREAAQRLLLSFDARQRAFALDDPELERDGERVRIELARAAGGDATLRVEPGGALDLDDAIVIRRRAPWSPAIATLPPRTSAGLETVAEYLEGALAGRRVGEAGQLAKLNEARLLLVEGGGFARWPKDGVVRILFGSSLPGIDREARWDAEAQWSRSDALLRGLDLSLVTAARRLRPSADLPASARVLARVDGEPVVLIDPTHRLLWFACDLESSSLGRQVFLPLLLLRALAELAPPEAGNALTQSEITSGLLDADESQLAASPPPKLAEPRWYEPAREYWPWLLLVVVLLLIALPFL